MSLRLPHEMKALNTLGSVRALPTAFRRGSHTSSHAAKAAVAPVRAVLEQMVVAKPNEQLWQSSNSGPAYTPPPAQPAVMPGDDDRMRFTQDPNVDMWKTFYPSRWLEDIDTPNSAVGDRIQAFTETLRSAVQTAGIFESSSAMQYWTYHLGRSSFFMLQGVASVAATQRAVGRNADSPAASRFEQLIRRGWSGPVTEALLTYWQDFQNIKQGKYVAPWDMTPGHRQFNPLFVLRRGFNFLGEAVDTLRRRDAGKAEDVWLHSPMLPEYFTKTFHYQSDGWLSSKSAQIYETSTETLFVGRQDAMQRGTLVPMHDFMAGRDASQVKALEIAAGTGRFATFVKDNYPQMQLIVSDLSPFYLQEARNNMQYWKQMRASGAHFGGADGTGVTFLQTAAEKLDVPDSSVDIVYSNYLFHELPNDIRKQAVAEMARVLRPGGLCILTDSVQLGDRDSMNASLGNFEDFNEPYYRNYVATPLGPLFKEAGFLCGTKLVSSSTKTLSFRKPLEEDTFALGGNAAAATSAVAAEVALEAQLDD
ncbi:hypothetical protein D9Q98_000300 [Chlorella vulgaris]|uniref:Methyltransferase domain-containing protein n=1 Tax=Chlorella vulgaris TaxID=3077 RepID=A0A9D4TXW5_CHLVU|nr:hypothetical protein D9Q98_000300 [Chlorella vulgaris]